MQHPPKVEPKRSKRPRRLIWMITALGLALAVAFVLLLPTIKQWFPPARYPIEEVPLTLRTLERSEREELQSLTVRHIAGDSYTLRVVGDQLQLEREGALVEVSELYADELWQAATEIIVQDTVAENAADVADYLSDMGLAPPQTVVTVQYRDGRSATIELGLGVPHTTYSYYRWSGAPGIYMCDIGISDAFSLKAERLLPVTQPVLEKTLIDELTLRRNGQSELSMTFTADSAGLISGTMQAPWHYAMSTESAASMLSSLQNLRLGTLLGEATAENRTKYGFDDPLCVVELHQHAGSRNVINADGQLMAEPLDEIRLRFTLGRTEGDAFYTCEYEGACYLVSRFLISALAEASPSALITRRPADLGGAELSGIRVQTGNGMLDIAVSRTERVLPNNQLETDEAGNPVYDIAILCNGQSMNADAFNGLCQRLAAMTIAGDLPAEWSPNGATPRWQIALTTVGGTTRTLAAYPLDAFSDAIAVDGVARHYLHVEALDSALAELMP
ncbi:MAG: DUF4340 domain-containing protein [Clostridia bacterium]